LQVAGKFAKPDSFDYKMAGAKIETEQSIADIFHGDQVSIAHLPSDPAAILGGSGCFGTHPKNLLIPVTYGIK